MALVIIGDSVTAPSGLFPHWPDVFQQRLGLQDGPHNIGGIPALEGVAPVVVRAVGGFSYAALAARGALVTGASSVIVALGINDYTGASAVPDLAAMQARIIAAVAAMRAVNPTCLLYLCTCPPFGFTGPPEETNRQAGNAWLATRPASLLGAVPLRVELAYANPTIPNLILTPGRVGTPGFGGVGGFAHDYVHPNAKGSVALADCILAQLLGLAPDGAFWGPGLQPGYSSD